MSSLTFTSAVLESFSRNGNGGKAKFSCSLNQKVSTAMGWTEIPECLTGASLEGELHATACEIVPSEAALKAHACDLTISEVSRFESIRLEIDGKKGKGHRTEIRFVVAFPDVKGAAKLEKYMLTVGEGKSSLTVSYVKQEMLPGTESEQDELEELVQTTARKRATSPAED